MAGVPLYIVNGFLESGKTEFLKFTMGQEYFADGEKTLLIVCEEGIEEYNEVDLANQNTVMVVVENEEDLTPEFLKSLKKKYRPERVLIEYNGMWDMNRLYTMKLPFNWDLYQVITTVNAETWDLYMNNMKSMAMEMMKISDLVIFNRCTEATPAALYKRSIKGVNRGAQVVFETVNGEMNDVEDEPPYDFNADVIEIADEDYGFWYIDIWDHPERYDKKTVLFKGQAKYPKGMKPGFFLPVRKIMNCCAEDITMYGIPCAVSAPVKENAWVMVKAKMGYMMAPTQDESMTPTLTAVSITPAEKPEEEVVTLN